MNQASSANPLVLIRIPAFNHEKYIERCLRSISADPYPNKLVVVWDDGSKDETPRIAEVLCSELGYCFRRNSVNRGLSATLNLINSEFALARPSFYFSIASDDEIVPGGLDSAVRALLAQPQAGGIYARAVMIDQDGRQLGEMPCDGATGELFFKVMYGEVRLPVQWFLWRKEVVERVGPFDPEVAMEDLYFFCKAARITQVAFSDHLWVRYRLHGTNTTRNRWHTYVHTVRLFDQYRSEPFYAELMLRQSINLWLLLAESHRREARRYFHGAATRFWDKRFLAGLLYFLGLGRLVRAVLRKN